MRLTGENICVLFYIPVILHLSWHLQKYFYPFHRGIWSVARGCTQPNSWESWERFPSARTVFWMKPSFPEACWKKEMLEPILVGHILVRAVLLPSCCSDSKVCTRRSYVLHLSLPEKIWSPHNPGSSPALWVISMGRGSVWHSHLYFL